MEIDKKNLLQFPLEKKNILKSFLMEGFSVQ